MRTTTCVTLIATAMGLAVTTGCGAGSPTGTVAAPASAAASAPASAPASVTGSAGGPASGSATTAAATPTPSSTGSGSSAGSGSRPVLTTKGLAGVPLGAGADRFAAVLGQRLGTLSATDRQTLAEYQCVYRTVSGVRGLALRVTGPDAEGPVQVISLTGDSRIRTSTGIALGDSLDKVRRVYEGNLLDQPIDFQPVDGHALVALAADGARWVFVADRKDVLVEIRLGSAPDVFDPEGCV